MALIRMTNSYLQRLIGAVALDAAILAIAVVITRGSFT